MTINNMRVPYAKPQLTKRDNIMLLTLECPEWQCSVAVPPPPQR